MAYVGIPLPSLARVLNATTITSQTIDANNDGAGMIFYAPVAGDIEAIGFNTTTRTSPPTFRIGLEGATTTRTPDGTYKASGNAYVDASPSATGWAWYTLGTNATVAAGDALAATIRYQTGTIGASNLIAVALRSVVGGRGFNGYAVTLTAGTWAADTGSPCFIAIRYTDGTIVGFPYSALTNNAFNSGSSPRYRGILWTPQATVKVSGAALCHRPNANSDYEIQVYEGSSGSPMTNGTVTLDPDVTIAGTGATQFSEATFPALLTFTAGTSYRIVINPTTVNSNNAFVAVTVPDTDSRDQWGCEHIRLTTADTPGTWTDTDLQFLPIIPILAEVDIPTGGGSRANIIGG